MFETEKSARRQVSSLRTGQIHRCAKFRSLGESCRFTGNSSTIRLVSTLRCPIMQLCGRRRSGFRLFEPIIRVVENLALLVDLDAAAIDEPLELRPAVDNMRRPVGFAAIARESIGAKPSRKNFGRAGSSPALTRHGSDSTSGSLGLGYPDFVLPHPVRKTCGHCGTALREQPPRQSFRGQRLNLRTEWIEPARIWHGKALMGTS